MRFIHLVLPFCLAVSLTHCLSYDLSRHIVQQGTLLPQDKVNRLKIGMTRQDVSQLLGSTLVHDLFDQDRIDYAFTLQKNNRPMIIKHVALTFKNDRLVQIQRYP